MTNKDVRQAILMTATIYFMRDGYNKTSTRQIADQLGIKQPVIYYYFKNKVNLYREVLTNYSQEIGEHLGVIAHKDSSVEERLIAMSLYLVNESHINLGQMMHDAMEVFGNEDHAEMFQMWHHSYFAPFEGVFDQVENVRADISLTNISRHFLRILTAYLGDSHMPTSDQEIIETVQIFMRGISA
ncbi:TetR/AcrR family transcriptional regulator [Periweissella fabalis]|uniref:TetR/AcrR family transcriptional regulator n=1 Tax=Periweissella fabalis TaxID=1070421 RepID=A0A7X6N3Q3_9LACO|nr:TetR/AcrR family transcriptional regulator [Periweissella fabalis]MCM0598102.1 TetR/AcrR family transcriptional regulator [Periweissella fabalis]NKZ24774.1 TetR/AcrR family transcriptional regulator [Periweissella fabalis]